MALEVRLLLQCASGNVCTMGRCIWMLFRKASELIAIRQEALKSLGV